MLPYHAVLSGAVDEVFTLTFVTYAPWKVMCQTGLDSFGHCLSWYPVASKEAPRARMVETPRGYWAGRSPSMVE